MVEQHKFPCCAGGYVGYVEGSIPLYTGQILARGGRHRSGRYLTSMGARYGGGIAAETPQGGYCVMTLVFSFRGADCRLSFREAHACERLYAAPEIIGPHIPSVKCPDEIGFFLRCSGSVLLLPSVTAGQASNRGSLASDFPFSAVFLLVWAADIGRDGCWMSVVPTACRSTH